MEETPALIAAEYGMNSNCSVVKGYISKISGVFTEHIYVGVKDPAFNGSQDYQTRAKVKLLALWNSKVDYKVTVHHMHFTFYITLLQITQEGKVCYFMLDESGCNIFFSRDQEGLATVVEADLRKFSRHQKDRMKEDNVATIKLVIEQKGDLQLRTQILTNFKPELFDLEGTYNDAFVEKANTMMGVLKEKRSGLHLLHGVPGCGKTSFIKYLCSLEIPGKRIMYLSPEMTNLLTKPAFLNFILNYPNTILVVEDAETILCKNAHKDSISNIRNMTDGIMGDILNIQIIATFNADIKDVDEAIKRPGRLITLHELKPLEIGKANKLLIAQDKPETTEPMKLADIFAEGEDISGARKIGF
jgi:hypothetical protein